MVQSIDWSDLIVKIMLFYLAFIILRVTILMVLSFCERFFGLEGEEVSRYPVVSIIIPCFNEEKVIGSALESVLNINYPNFEVIVVDDGSFDLTTEWAKKFEKKGPLRVVFQENGGKAAALNRGIDEACGELILCMDADSQLGSDVLKNAVPYFEKYPQLGALAGNVKIVSSWNILTLFQKLEYIIGLNFHKKAQSFLNMVVVVPGPIGIFRQNVIHAVGGYHTSTFAEDSDLSMRILLAGYEIKYASNVNAYTEGPATFHDLMTQRYRWTRGLVQALLKNTQLLKKNRNLRNYLIMFYTFLETLAIPAVNFIFIMLTLHFALMYDYQNLMGTYFLGLIFLDLMLSLYSVVEEKKIGLFCFLAIVNRVTYGLALETMRFFGLLDELFKIPMKWGVLPRKGIKINGN